MDDSSHLFSSRHFHKFSSSKAVDHYYTLSLDKQANGIATTRLKKCKAYPKHNEGNLSNCAVK